MPANSYPVAPGVAAKWMGLVTALWVQAIAGNNYTFSNYSVALKAILHCNQLQLNNLSVAKDVGKAFGLVGGLLVDILPPSTILLIGSIEGLLGYGLQWLVISRRLQPLPYWQMCVAMCLGGNSTTWMNTAVLVTCMRNFRRSRGHISGILKGYIGLSTAIFTDVCAALFTGDPASFVLMLAVVPFIICTIAMIFLRPVESEGSEVEDEQDRHGFLLLNLIAVILAFYLLAFDIIGPHRLLPSKIFASFLLLLLASPIFLPPFLLHRLKKKDRAVEPDTQCWPIQWRQSHSRAHDSTMPLLSDGSEPNLGSVLNGAVGSEKQPNLVPKLGPTRKPIIGEEHTISQALQTLDFWLLFFTFLCSQGLGMAVLNNLGQTAESLGYSSAAIFISLTSISGFFGRIVSGALSEYAIRSSGMPRPMIMELSQLVMIVGYALLATAVPGSLYIGSSIMGICYGVRIAVSVPTASELFGLKFFGLMYNILILNLPLGSFLFSGLLAGFLYDREAEKGSGMSLKSLLLFGLRGRGMVGGGDALTCLGAHCYRLVFILMAVICFVGFLMDFLLALRTRRLYTSMQVSRR